MRIPFLGENHSDIGGTKMKRIAAILLAVLALLLGACSVQRYSDAAMFCRRFNREYKESLLDIETATVTETDGCTVFSLTPDENISAKLNIPNENEYATAITQYTQGEAVRYAYSADVAGAFFCMENKSLCRTDEEHLTLRDDGTDLKS